MTLDAEINILLSTNDNNFSQTLFVIYSIIKKRNSTRIYNIYLFTLSLSETNAKNFYSLTEEKINLEIINIDRNIFQGIYLKNYPTEAILRLLAAELLPEKQKILYLDTDILVLSGIESLYDLDLNKTYAAVVHDGLPDYKRSATQYRTAIGMKNTKLYFNSGVMLINIPAWKSNQIFEKSILWFGEFGSKGSFADQDALNVILEGRVKYIPERWNLQITLLNSILYKGKIASVFRNELTNAQIIHFAGERKPWNYNGYLPFSYQYKKEFNKFSGAFEIKKLHNKNPRFYLELLNHYIKRLRSKLRKLFKSEPEPINLTEYIHKN